MSRLSYLRFLHAFFFSHSVSVTFILISCLAFSVLQCHGSQFSVVCLFICSSALFFFVCIWLHVPVYPCSCSRNVICVEIMASGGRYYCRCTGAGVEEGVRSSSFWDHVCVGLLEGIESQSPRFGSRRNLSRLFLFSHFHSCSPDLH